MGSWSQDQGCVDVSIGASSALGGGTLEDPRIDLQLKCTSDERHLAEALIIRRCAYWLSMAGLPPITSESKVVHLPRTNVFSPEQLRSMMERVSRGEPP
ncbi:hypothetical protein [Archangium sp.]|uniref:hypothetical protein n=1 Tax=Archangium sp. TaxID=1872627 RepID=UPI002D2C7C03|nr:hypothetical protein [Archangium sp.]HYO58726.1 hypothetical protein [Archangium sp.]